LQVVIYAKFSGTVFYFYQDAFSCMVLQLAPLAKLEKNYTSRIYKEVHVKLNAINEPELLKRVFDKFYGESFRLCKIDSSPICRRKTTSNVFAHSYCLEQSLMENLKFITCARFFTCRVFCFYQII